MSVAQRLLSDTDLRRSRTAVLGTFVIFTGAAMIGLLCTTGAGVNPLSQPLSLNALTPAAWLFDAGVVVVALGLGLLLVALIRTGRLASRSLGSAAIVACTVGLILLTIFPDHDPHGDLTAVGWVHWAASMVAFGTLPIAPILLGRRHRRAAGCSRLPGMARLLGVVAAALLLVFAVGCVLQFAWSVPTGRIGGAVERVLVAVELAAALLIGLWAWRGCPATDASCRTVGHQRQRSSARSATARRTTLAIRGVGQSVLSLVENPTGLDHQRAETDAAWLVRIDQVG